MKRVTVTLPEEQVEALDEDPRANNRSEAVRRAVEDAQQGRTLDDLGDRVDQLQTDHRQIEKELEEVLDEVRLLREQGERGWLSRFFGN